MNCNEMRELASELYDGTLAPRERATLERHLAQCGACRAELALFTSATAALRGLASAAPAAPAGHVAAVLAALPPGGRPRRVAGLVLAAACGAAAMLLVWLGASLLAAEPPSAPQIASVPAAQPAALRPFPVILPLVWVRERKVEVPVPVPVTREVRVSVVDPGSRRAALALGRMALALSALAEVAEQALAVPAAEHVAQVATPAPERPAAAPERPESPVLVRREPERVTLELRGGWPEVVPGLIDLLESEDREIAVIAEHELEVIQGMLTPGVRPRATPRPAQDSSPLGRSLFGGREDEDTNAPPPGPAEWRLWWQDHGLTALEAEVL